VVHNYLMFNKYRSSLSFEDKYLKGSGTDNQRAQYLERASRLRQKIDSFFEVQQVYMPRLGYIRRCQNEEAGPELPVYDVPLLLPSSCVIANGLDHRRFDAKLYVFEYRVRMGEAGDALESLRRHLMTKSTVWHLRRVNQMGQRNLTRSQTVVTELERKINADAARYRRAYQALSVLGPLVKNDEWKTQFQVLKDTDIRELSGVDHDGMGHAPLKGPQQASKYNQSNQPSEGRRTYSWIWFSTAKDFDVSKENTAEADEGLFFY
jgi:hypothetical protein